MRLALRVLRPAPNQSGKPGLWQDPIFGYWETHGRMEFKSGEQYDMTEKEKKAVLERYRIKEILKKEYLRREYDPVHFKYREGIVMDPAMFRWYASDMSQTENFRWTPKTVFVLFGVVGLIVWLYFRIAFLARERSLDACSTGELLWWDRQSGRKVTTAGHNFAGYSSE